MADVLQIECPKCRNPLRIPSNWAEQSLRCKFCQHVFQAPKKATAPPAAQASRKRRGESPKGNPFDFDNARQIKAPTAPRPAAAKNPKRWLIGLAGVGVLLIAMPVAGVAVYLLGSSLWKMAQSEAVQDPDLKAPKKKDAQHSPGDKSADKPQEIAKVDVPETGNKTGQTSGGGNPPIKVSVLPNEPPAQRTKDIYPRRALLISVSDYTFAVPLAYGRPQGGVFNGSSPGALARLLQTELDFPRNQVAELSDKLANTPPPVKSTIETTISEFLATSRAQDHILLLFAGHAVEAGNNAYLVPLDGKLDDPQKLISFTWLYTKLAKCQARQKVVVLDVCRFDPARPAGQPGNTPMGGALEGAVKSPPAGVEVWAACGTKEQSLETDKGSLFLEMICKNCTDLPTPPNYGIPVKKLAARVRMDVEDRSASLGHVQVPVLLGTEPAGPGPFDPKETQPPAVTVKSGAAKTEKIASFPALDLILNELALFPPTTGGKSVRINPASLPAFPPKVLDPYAADYTSLLDFKDKEQEFPLRSAVARAVVTLQDNIKGVKMRNRADSGLTDKSLQVYKNQVEAEQKSVAQRTYVLKELVREMGNIGEKESGAESKRWQVLFDFAMLKVKARLVYVEEYNFKLAEIRGDRLPTLGEGESGYKLTPNEKLSINEGVIKDYYKEIKRGWAAMAKNYPDTPWAFVAVNEEKLPLGLSWTPMKK